MTKMTVISKRDGSRELQWVAAWGATRAPKKNTGTVLASPTRQQRSAGFISSGSGHL